MDYPKIAFFGTPQNAAIVLEKLAKTKFKPQLVVTGEDVQKGRGRKTEETPVKTIAAINKIDVAEPQNLTDPNFVELFKGFAPDITILIAYGKIIPDQILKIPKHGFLNIHPSLLPKYRGPSPIYEAILNGDEKTGITIIKLDSELDHGPILAQKDLEIEKTDTHQTLIEKTAILGAETLIDILPKYLSSRTDLSRTQEQTSLLTPQDHSKATWTEKVEKANGKIDVDNPPDKQTLDRMVRAYYPWPTVWFQIEGKRFRLLPENKIHPEGKKPMTLQELKNGYPKIAQKVEELLGR